MNLDDILKEAVERGDHVIKVVPEEAALIDWVLTAHTWDADLIDRLDTPKYWALREQVGRVLVGHTDQMVLEDDDVHHLLILVPILFAVGHVEAGSALKTKLYECLVGPAPVKEKEPDAEVRSPQSEDYGGE